MSSEALYWLTTQGAAVQVPSSQAIGEARAWRVLANLTAHASEATGELWVSDRTQEKETGIPRRLIREARALLIEAGLLVDTGKTRTKGVKVYALHLPGYTWRAVDSPTSGQGSGQASGQGSGQGTLPQTEQNLNTPLPPTNRPGRERDKTQGGGREWGDRHTQVLALCLTIERGRTRGDAGPGLVRKWEQDYRPIVTAALSQRPGLSNDVLARECATERAGGTAATLTAPAPTPQPRADCPKCRGAGWWGEKTQDRTTRRVSCPCATSETTPERVTVERAPNTDPGGPTAPADPQSDPAGDLAKRLRRVV